MSYSGLGTAPTALISVSLPDVVSVLAARGFSEAPGVGRSAASVFDPAGLRRAYTAAGYPNVVVTSDDGASGSIRVPAPVWAAVQALPVTSMTTAVSDAPSWVPWALAGAGGVLLLSGVAAFAFRKRRS